LSCTARPSTLKRARNTIILARRKSPHEPYLRARTTDDGEQPDGEMFVADITEIVITGLDAQATKLVVESWTPERGLRRLERE
jgi:hypothetical protein